MERLKQLEQGLRKLEASRASRASLRYWGLYEKFVAQGAGTVLALLSAVGVRLV